jgi:hypothetical protein
MPHAIPKPREIVLVTVHTYQGPSGQDASLRPCLRLPANSPVTVEGSSAGVGLSPARDCGHTAPMATSLRGISMFPHPRSSLYARTSSSSLRQGARVLPADETSRRFRVAPVSGSTVDLSIDVQSMARIGAVCQWVGPSAVLING